MAIPSTPGSSYHWTVNGGQIIGGFGTHDILIKWGPHSGLFPVQVRETNSNGCQGDPVKAFVFLSLPDQAKIRGPEVVCRGTPVILSGQAGDDFLWQGGFKKQTINFTPLRDTTIYLVALNNPCKNDTIFHNIKVVDQPVAGINILPDTLQLMDFLELQFTGAAASVSWFINGRELGRGIYLKQQMTRAGKKTIVQVVDNGLCYDTIVKEVYVNEHFAVHIPNAFTPNGDDINEVFRFEGVGIKSYNAMIYNRWGEMLFAWNESSAEGWDGTYKGVPVDQGVYVYKIIVRDFYNREHPYEGHVTLLR